MYMYSMQCMHSIQGIGRLMYPLIYLCQFKEHTCNSFTQDKGGEHGNKALLYEYM